MLKLAKWACYGVAGVLGAALLGIVVLQFLVSVKADQGLPPHGRALATILSK